MISPPENANTAGSYAAENKITSPIVFDQSQVAIAYFKATPTNPGSTHRICSRSIPPA